MTITNAVVLDLVPIDDRRSIKAREAFKTFRASSGVSKTLL